MIYFIGNRGEGVVKIGKSLTPSKRLRQLQTACPFKLEIIKVYDISNFFEKSLHRVLKEYRIDNEWFKITGKLEDAINHDLLFFSEIQTTEFRKENGAWKEYDVITRTTILKNKSI